MSVSVIQSDGSPVIVPAYGTAYAFVVQGWLANAILTGKDFLSIQGSATKTVRIKHIKLQTTGDGTNLGGFSIEVVRESTTPTTNGTATTVTGRPYDINSDAATAVLKTYTATVTNGTGSLLLDIGRTSINGTTALGTALKDTIDLNYTIRQEEAPILRGTGDFITLRAIGGAPTTSVTDILVVLEESDE